MTIKIRTLFLIFTFIIGISFAQTVLAETITGIVTKVHPVYENYTQTTPYQDCYNHQVFVPNNRFSSSTPSIAGGIFGGVIGNKFGKGDGKTILTVAGALLGSSIGSDIGKLGNGYTKNIERCETRYSERANIRIRGYNIGVTTSNGHFINTYKEIPYNPPPIHSHVKIQVNYTIGNY